MTMVTSNSHGKAPMVMQIQNKAIKLWDGANCRGLRLADNFELLQMIFQHNLFFNEAGHFDFVASCICGGGLLSMVMCLLQAVPVGPVTVVTVSAATQRDTIG